MSPNFFIVGRGFTHAATGKNAPLNSSLLQSIRPIAPDLWDELTSRYPSDDIEVILTRLDLEIAPKQSNSELTQLRRDAEASLAKYFSRFRFQEDSQGQNAWLLDLATSIFREGDTVVSLNYDCLLEGLLDRCKLWSPNGGYGPALPVGPGLEEEWCPSPVTVLKIHGSESFHRDPVFGSHKSKAIFFTIEESLFPISGQGFHGCLPGRGSTPAIIAPSFVKVLPAALMASMMEALEKARGAKAVVLIGCGMRREDTFLHLLLWHSLNRETRIIIVDPNAHDLGARISTTFEYDIGSIVLPIEKTLDIGWRDLATELKSRPPTLGMTGSRQR